MSTTTLFDRQLAKLIVAVVMLAVSSCYDARGEATGAPPLNFVFILVDDLGQRDLGCYGSTFYETPNLDALAQSGMRFTSAYSACQVCSPTRASIQSGKYPARLHTTDYFGGPTRDEALVMPRFKHRRLLPPNYSEQLPLEEVTIAEALQEVGYATFFTGKWHLGPQGYWPEDQGYEINIGGNRAGHSKTYFSPYNNPKLTDGPAGEQLDERLAHETVKFVNDHRDKPFLAFFSQFDVHLPLQTKPELKAKYAAKAKRWEGEAPTEPEFAKERASNVRQIQKHPVYAGMVETMDAAVGIVLRGLEEAGVADRTVVIFTSDNGGLSTAEGAPTSNLPFRGGKGWAYEGGLRVPLIIRWPGVTKPGSQCEDYIISTDYYPTMLDMAALPPRPEQHVDGKSFAPLLRDEAADFARGPIYWHYPHYGNQGGVPARAIRDGQWKLIEFMEDDTLELYNLSDDLGEHRNLVATEPERVERMKNMLHDWCDSVGAQMPTPNPNHEP